MSELTPRNLEQIPQYQLQRNSFAAATAHSLAIASLNMSVLNSHHVKPDELLSLGAAPSQHSSRWFHVVVPNFRLPQRLFHLK